MKKTTSRSERLDIVALLSGDAARCMMPGWARERVSPPDLAAVELHHTCLVAALQRVKTWPAKTDSDLAFIKSVRGKRYGALAPAAHARLMVLAWRYRGQLPAFLRPRAAP
jgi:hypothetical protein